MSKEAYDTFLRANHTAVKPLKASYYALQNGEGVVIVKFHYVYQALLDQVALRMQVTTLELDDTVCRLIKGRKLRRDRKLLYAKALKCPARRDTV
jgi:hypothetical protein